MSRAALVQRGPSEAFALLRKPLKPLGDCPSQVTVSDFVGHVNSLAQILPSAKHAVNLCENRYLFLVAFCALIVREQCNLLPQNRAKQTQQSLVDTYPETYILHDGISELCHAQAIDISEHTLTRDDTSVAEIPLAQLCAIAFTSGSTGQPKPNLKYWRTLRDSTEINAHHMLSEDKRFHALATVPAQHMWGLETSALIPLLRPVCTCDAKPLFPQDVLNALNALPSPRALISTPVHLRALIHSGIEFPKIDTILCATAPLPQALARQVEACFQGQLVEVFGCSEVGSMARRETARESDWTLFDGLNLREDGHTWHIDAQHLPITVALQDRIEKGEGQRFRLLGRNEDMVEIAGKRGSLQEMNKILADFPGLQDGIVFLPQQQNQEIQRPAAIVAVDAPDKQALLNHFAERLDRVFLPRPIYFVEALPREENGKLRQSEIHKLFRQLREKNSVTEL
jgi:acyl-coenzyme A synthetase/AMP-(fatty) acid ligase